MENDFFAKIQYPKCPVVIFLTSFKWHDTWLLRWILVLISQNLVKMVIQSSLWQILNFWFKVYVKCGKFWIQSIPKCCVKMISFRLMFFAFDFSCEFRMSLQFPKCYSRKIHSKHGLSISAASKCVNNSCNYYCWLYCENLFKYCFSQKTS